MIRPALTVCVLALSLPPSSGEARETFIRGDANGDGTFDLGDAITTWGALWRGVPLSCLDAADTNRDGRIDTTDAVISLLSLYGGRVTVAPPHPEPGVDPDSTLGCEAGCLSLGTCQAPSCRERARADLRIPTSYDEERGRAGLNAVIFHAAGAGCRLPTILVITPYDLNKALRQWFSDGGNAPLFRSAHYNYVIVDWRGFFGSADAAGEGAPSPGEDGVDIINWIARQAWSNGIVGTYGASALGTAQFSTALEWTPGQGGGTYAAAVPVFSSLVDGYQHYYPGGVFRRDYGWFLLAAGWESALKTVIEHPTRDGLWSALEALHDPADIEVPMLLVAGWYDHHQEFDTLRELRERSHSAVRGDHRLLVGPWTHFATVDEASSEHLQFTAEESAFIDHERVIQTQALAFLDRHLRGVRNETWDAPIRFYREIEDTWDHTETWPPADTTLRTLYLAPPGDLVDEVPPVGGSISYVYRPSRPSPSYGGLLMWFGKVWWCLSSVAWSRHCDPDEVDALSYFHGPTDQRPVLDWGRATLGNPRFFQSPALPGPLVLQGEATATLHVSTDQIDTDFVVRLVDVHPDGALRLLADGVRRLRYRHGYTEADIEWAEPGMVYELEIPFLNHLAYTIERGHRIGLVVSSSNYPRFDIHPNTTATFMDLTDPDLVYFDSLNTIHTGSTTPSRLALSVALPRTAEQ